MKDKHIHPANAPDIKPRITPNAAPNVTPNVKKGRGAVISPANRYADRTTESVDDGWQSIETLNEDPAPETIVTHEQSRSIISRNKSPDIPFDYSINPYRGCEHGCVYCYARPTHAYWDMSPGIDFETRITARINAPELLRKTLSSPRYQVKPLCIGANTDPYQPAEKELRITRALIDILGEFHHPFSIITKSHLITRDIDLLTPLAEKNLCSVAISVTTLDNDLKRKLEPRTPAGRTRLDAIRQLTDAGIRVTLLAAPMIPFINDQELESILAAGRQAGAVSARYILLRLPLEISDMFRAWLASHFPDRADRVMNAIRHSRGGRDYRSVFGERMVGTGQFAELLNNRWQVCCRKLGFRNDERFQLDYSLFAVPSPQQSLF